MTKRLKLWLSLLLVAAAALLLMGQSSNGNKNANTAGNTVAAGAFAYYAAASGSTAISADPNFLDNGTGMQVPTGSTTNPTFVTSNATNTGLIFPSSAVTCGINTGNNVACMMGAGLAVASGKSFNWSSTTSANGTPDTGISRGAADIIDLGNGTATDTSGKVKAAGYMSVGATFTTNAGCGEGTLTGGATAGRITTSGQTSCTDVITMGNSASAPNGWQCSFTDLTTIGDVTNPHMTATSQTTVTWASGTIVSGDVISFACIGY